MAIVQAILLLIGILPHSPALAFTKASKCSQKQLKLKDCAIETMGYQIHLFGEKLILFDGQWRGVEKLPLSGEKIEWQKVQVMQKKKRKFIEMLVWDNPSGEANIQSLRWQLLELNGPKFKLVLDKVVRKRTPYLDDDKQQKFHLDKKIPFSLYFSKGRLHWRVDQQKGVVQ